MEQLATICRRYGVVRLDVFGSAASGRPSNDSDVDLLYELAAGSRLGWDIEQLTAELAQVFGRPVDLVSRAGLNQRLRDRVLSEARLLYAA